MASEEVEESVKKFSEIINKVVDNPDEWPDSATFISLSTVAKEKILTPKRLEILEFIKDNEVESVSELAEKVDRSLNNVSRDLSLLKNHNLVEIEKDGRKKKPSLNEGHLFVLF